MTRADFEFIRNLAYHHTGIVLPDRKNHMVYSRLCRRLRALKMKNFSEYCQYLQHEEEELAHFINALTTNLTSFFREKHHFEFLRDQLVPHWQQQRRRRLRVWSAACSTGEEPYSIALTLEAFFPRSHWDLKILATDLDTNVLTKAEAGVYPAENLENLPRSLVEKYFQPQGDKARINDCIKELVYFRQLNLLDPWPMQGPFDAIFCRNVLIYFDIPTKSKIIHKFRQLLNDDGYLFIGHSETLHLVSDEFDLIGQTIYRPRSDKP
ncbi:protein-glutamate O-methyltransferase CheR [Shewanella sp.]|uniref:CheR family methyltransferase n=1 Tax=Shewanella sp. TaxID=50422 RepID=UPI003567E8B5